MGMHVQIRGAAAMAATSDLASNYIWSRITGTTYDPVAVDAVAHEVVNVEDVSGVFYIIQLRRK